MSKLNEKPLKPWEIVRQANSVIIRENLYLISDGWNRRMIDARVVDGVAVVMDLYTERDVPILGNKFMNGYGSEVIFG